ncbi:MAG: YiiX/YebB-like N1pC/P60 family cysteine hydrolase [Ginsengibacter sp.]
MIFSLKIFFDKRRLLGCLLFFASACNNKHTNDIIHISINDSLQAEKVAGEAFYIIEKVKENVKQGDLILRTGRDFTSDAMRRLSVNDKTYSHCGIASFENDSLFVYHAIGGEWNPDQKLRRDPFEFFCNPYENRGIGIFRYSFNNEEQEKLLQIVQTLYRRGICFDMKFDLNSDDRMYCSEFVYKSIEMAANYKINLPLTTLNSIKFVAVDNLFMNPYCTAIKRVVYNSR